MDQPDKPGHPPAGSSPSPRPQSQISKRPPSQIIQQPSGAVDKAGQKLGEKLKGGASPSQTRIEMICPSCGTAGAIKMGSLGQQIACKKCNARFRITHTGKIVPATESQILKRPAFDEGIEAPHRLVVAWNKLPTWGKGATVAGGTVAGILLLYLVMFLSRTSLPDGLEARARMAGEAVARNHRTHVRALAVSGTQGQAEEWLMRTRPAKWADVTGEMPIKIEVRVLFQDPGRAGTLVTVEPGAKDATDVQLLQRGDSARAAEHSAKAASGGAPVPVLGSQSLLLYWVFTGDDWLLDGKETLQNHTLSLSRQ
jgi:hypothetical protein